MSLIEFINILIQLLLGIIALSGVGFAIYKICKPNLQISIISFYDTMLKDGELACVLKIKTNSAADIVIKTLKIFALQEDRKNLMEITALRQKGFLFLMKDMQGQNCYFKLKKTLEPNLEIHGIKSGINEYYISLKSALKWEGVPDKKIISWEFEIQGNSPLSFVPAFLPMKISAVKASHPEKNNYIDDSLIQKISNSERDEIIKEL